MSDIFSDPIFLILMVTIVGGSIASVYFLAFKKKIDVVLEREKPGISRLIPAKLIKKKGESDYNLNLEDADKRKLTVAKENVKDAEILRIAKKITIPKGILRLWPMENGQLVAFNGSLTEQPDPLLDSETVSAVVNRSSARRLAKVLGGLGSQWTLIILAIGMGLAIGYIMYPQFNHPATAIEYCTKTVNGTFTCGILPP